jgi:hypothetical protein
MTTPSNEDRSPDITVSDLARELGLTHYQVKVHAAGTGLADTEIYRSRNDFWSDHLMTGKAANLVRAKRDSDLMGHATDAQDGDLTVVDLARRLGVSAQVVRSHADEAQKQFGQVMRVYRVAGGSVLTQDAVDHITHIVDRALEAFYAPEERAGDSTVADGLEQALQNVRDLSGCASMSTFDAAIDRLEAVIRADERAAVERKACARRLWDMVGKHGRANDAALYRAAAVTLDPSLADEETDRG